ncbi:MFS transporter [Actinomadura sp. WMMA1423]|uniref:MFS transporter n=1 Tax=Actinomadura sp. WMMA1423 TaxID=2591108 RepID=UPI001146AE5F|nr:MFS transporter [Actinomadura sp. WMMA1423]
MTPHAPRPLFRAARAVVFATVCATLATLGHVLAGGAAVPAWAAITGFCAVLGVTLILAGHERSLATIMGGLLGGQFALHTLFTAATSSAHAAPDTHAAMTGAMEPAAIPAGHGGNGLVMTLAHCTAALVAAWWLRRGERAAWSLARRVAALADRPIRLLLALLAVEPAEPPARPCRTAPAAAAVTAVGRVLRHQVVRRGPPTRSRALAHL